MTNLNPLAEFYSIDLQEGDLVIEKGSKTHFSASLAWIFGVLIFVVGLYSHLQIVLLGLVLFLLPWISRKWQYPDKIHFSKEGYLLLETGSIIPNLIRIQRAEIEELQIEKVTKYADASPFRDGYQDFIYNFIIETPHKRYKLVSVTYHQEESDKIEEIRSFFLQSLQILKRKKS